MKKAVMLIAAAFACMVLTFLLGYGLGRNSRAPIQGEYYLLPPARTSQSLPGER